MENEIYEALGLESPEETGGEAGEAAGENADPVSPENESGESTQEPAAPAAETESQAEPEQPAEPQPQSAEENARYAAIRRKAEEEAKRRAEKEMDSILQSTGILNPYTQAPISSLKELEAYREKFREEKRKEFLDGNGMTPEQYDQFVSGLPEVQEAREQAERFTAMEAKARIEADVQEIKKFDPEIKTISDIAQKEEYPELCQMVEKGYSLADAWKLRHFDEIAQKKAEAAHQAALNSVQEKDHLAKTEQRGEGGIAVPAAIMEEYRAFMPNASDEEIQRHYAAYAKNQK